MQGAPPPPERLVTSDNWIEGPFNRWGFLHVRELARTARIPRGDGPVFELPRDPLDLGPVLVPFEGSKTPFAASLEQTYTDGICIVHDGRVVFEQLRRRDATRRHASPDVRVEVAHRDLDRRPRRRRRARSGRRGDRVHRRTSRHGLGRLHAAAPARHAHRHALRRGGLRRSRQRRRADRRDLRLPDHIADPTSRRTRTHGSSVSTTTASTAAHSSTARSSPTCSHGRPSRPPGCASPICSPTGSGAGSAPSATRRSSSTRPGSPLRRAASARRCATSRASG